DISMVTGFSKDNKNGWNWDFSNSFGYNDFHYYGAGTFNASDIGNITKTNFDDGGFNFLQHGLYLRYIVVAFSRNWACKNFTRCEIQTFTDLKIKKPMPRSVSV
ncbi:MAG: hypothetical protein J0649_07535, partial [Methylococcales bacterium]|nr:hypothetical protein [Methylococcales bacterium]